MSDKPTRAIQENLLSLICFSETNGRIISRTVSPDLFEGDYQLIAERALGFWTSHDAPPKLHIFDELSDILESDSDRRAPVLRNVLQNLEPLAAQVNPQYALHTATTFTKVQRYKATIIRAGRRLEAKEALALDEVDEMFAQMLSTRELNFDPGIQIDNFDAALAMMQKRRSEFRSGVGVLDRRGIVPGRGTIYLMIGRKGIGKSWFLINMAKQAHIRGQKVLYITLELYHEMVLLRFYQSLFATPNKNYKEYKHLKFIVNDDGYVTDFDEEEYEPDFTLRSLDIRDELSTRLRTVRTDNMYIKKFPKRGLTVNGLRTFLDNLEATQHFTPDILIIDYPQIMKIDTANWRIDMGRTYEDLENVLVERDMAGVFVHQASREGAKAQYTRATHANEDFSVVQTADTVLTVSMTDQERNLGLGRILVENAREEEDRYGVLFTHDYRIGQFCLDSVPLPSAYDKLVTDHTNATKTIQSASGNTAGSHPQSAEADAATASRGTLFNPQERQRGGR